MLHKKLRRALGFTLWLTCYCKFIPFDWDHKAFRFKKAIPTNLKLHYSIFTFQVFITLFTWARFVQLLTRDFEPRPFIMAFVFSLARAMEMVNFSLFRIRRKEIFSYGNAVLGAIDNSRERRRLQFLQNNPGKAYKEKWIWDGTSVILTISSFLILVNAPIHGMLVIETPCVPHFVSSIILDCKSDMDKSFPISHKIPLVLLETFLMMSMLQGYTFCWTLIFLGSGWVQEELIQVKKLAMSKNQVLRAQSYFIMRKIQFLIRCLNNGFRYYLIWAPSLTLAITVLLLYGIIRFHEADITNYLMFPTCVAHCIFEGYSLLMRSGHINATSKEIFRIWKRNFILNYNQDKAKQKYLQKFRQSFQPLMITAGSMYTFENTIVLTNIHKLLSSTLRLLVAYK